MKEIKLQEIFRELQQKTRFQRQSVTKYLELTLVLKQRATGKD